METKERVKFKIDQSLCSGCNACALNCALKNHGQNNPKLAHIQIISHLPIPGGYKTKFKDCLGCGECARVCILGAIVVRRDKE